MRHWNNRLLTEHTRSFRTRFNPAGPPSPLYRVLYLGGNHQVAIYEVGALLGDPMAPVSNPRGSWALMSLKVRLHRVVDLTDPDQQNLIATNEQELTGNWVNYSGGAPTQILGATLNAMSNIEGIIVPSAKAGSQCLVVFMDNIDPHSLIECHNEISGLKERLT